MPVRTDRQPGEKITAADINALAFLLNQTETDAELASTTATEAATTAEAAYQLPPGGATVEELLSVEAQGTVVRGNGTVTRILAMPQADYDALPSTDPATLYVRY